MPTENPTNVITAIVVALEKVDSIEFVRTSSSEPRTTTMDDGRPLLFLLVVMVAGWKWISIPSSFPSSGRKRRKICFGYADYANLKWDSREKVRERSRRVDLNFPIKKKI